MHMPIKTLNLYKNENPAVQDAYSMLTANLHVGSRKHKIKTLAMTSCLPREGKTTIAISLAIAMAQSEWRVLLVDADMRKPIAAKRLSDESLSGFSDYLDGKAKLVDILSQTNIPNLMYLFCGSNHPNPVSLLCSARFEEFLLSGCSEYDFILFDTPALTSVVDGALVAAKVDAALLVVEMGTTTSTCLKRVKDQLENLNVNILGVVLNKVKKRDYKTYFKSYNYFYNPKGFLSIAKKKEQEKRGVIKNIPE